MGKLEDAATWLIFYVIRPAVQKVIDKLNESYRIYTEIAFIKLSVFLHWIATSNISIFTWVNNKIADAIEEIEDNDGGWFDWIWDIVDSVLDAIEDIFVKVSKLSNKVLTIIADWWETTRDLFLSTLKDTFVSVADFAVDVQEAIADWWTDTWTMITETISSTISAAVDAITTTVTNIAESVSKAIADIIDTVTNAIANIEDSITDFTIDIMKDLAETESKIRTLLTDKINEVMTYINEEIPKVVGSMFEWAKPVIDPIIAAAGWLGSLTNIFTGTAPEDPRIRTFIDEEKTNREELDRLLEQL